MLRSRVYNFSAGPSALPESVLAQAAAELLDWRGSGMSVMEISHRSAAFLQVAQQAEADLRELLAVPAHYRVLFLQGGASLQFAAVPLNLSNADSTVAYVNTGLWSEKAIAEARRYARVSVVADAQASGYRHVPAQAQWQIPSDACYLHYTSNETIGGVEFPFIPSVGDLPLVADMSSHILSRPLDVSRFGLIYAGAQKNAGPAGITLVLVREDLLGRARAQTPLVMNYQHQAAEGSMLNTPATYSWYLSGLVFRWLKAQGGLAAIAKVNDHKARLLYDYLDASTFYRNEVARADRSAMNVVFTVPDVRLEPVFVSEAAEAGLMHLKGHKRVGGLRASLYNAMPLAGVQALIVFMRDFATRHG